MCFGTLGFPKFCTVLAHLTFPNFFYHLGKRLTCLSLNFIPFPKFLFLKNPRKSSPPPLRLSTQEYQRAVIFRLGRTRRRQAVGPGLFFVLPCIDSISVVDLRTVSFNVPPQEILSRDSVTVRVDAVVYYRIMVTTTERNFCKNALYFRHFFFWHVLYAVCT